MFSLTVNCAFSGGFHLPRLCKVSFCGITLQPPEDDLFEILTRAVL